jgi:hypothetical protein
MSTVEWDDFLVWWNVGPRTMKRRGGGCLPVGGFFRKPRFERAAKQVIVSRARNKALAQETAVFRHIQRPNVECKTCGRAFALYSEYREHRCGVDAARRCGACPR